MQTACGGIDVSISQSRYFSFQVTRAFKPVYSFFICFNLAIEILFFSRQPAKSWTVHPQFNVSISQSRYFSFQVSNTIFDGVWRPPFQSRNRDTFLFKIEGMGHHCVRDALVSISQSRYFSFQDSLELVVYFHAFKVSISQSRYFSFQAFSQVIIGAKKIGFQSRNRDTFLFKYVAIPTASSDRDRAFQSRNRDTFLFKWGYVRSGEFGVRVSISQSRYFSFQDNFQALGLSPECRFNLAIEILFFSSRQLPVRSRSKRESFNLAIEILFFSRICWWFLPCPCLSFQSRNRDTFLFKPNIFAQLVACGLMFQSRNRDTFLFKETRRVGQETQSVWFQSRNRDTFLFKEVKEYLPAWKQNNPEFQSRNRDTFLFKE